MQGVFVGSATSLSFMTWLCLSAQRAISTGELTFETKEVSTSGCNYHFIAEEPMSMLAINGSTLASIPSSDDESDGFQIYHISYLWYTLIGSLICIIVSLITSFIIGPNAPKELDEKLLAPFVRKLIKSPKSDLKPLRDLQESVL